MSAGITEQPTAAESLAVAHLMLRRVRLLPVAPLPFWAGWPARGAPDFR